MRQFAFTRCISDAEHGVCLLLHCSMQVPCLTYGMRGMISASIEVKGPKRDLHSGNEGGEMLGDACPYLLGVPLTWPERRQSFLDIRHVHALLIHRP